jgi:hypothetical protein
LFRVQHMEALPGDKRRIIAIGGVLLIHLLIVALILSGTPRMFGTRADSGEIFFVFAPIPTSGEKLPTAAPTRPERAPVFRQQTISPGASVAPAPQINGLGQSLLQCAPENLANLSPEELDRCPSASVVPSPGDAIPGTVREHAVNAEAWSAAIARRNTPFKAPCSTLRAIPEDVTTGRTAKVIIVDPLCALGLTKRSNQ